MFTLRCCSIIYFYFCGVNTNSVKVMQTLLNDIELDIQELKYLVQTISSDANPALRTVAKRNIQQMKERLDTLQKWLDISSVPRDVETNSIDKTPEFVQTVITSSPSILAERIKPITDLRRAISLNDSFRFVRELFGGDAGRMNAVVEQLGKASSLDEAMEIWHSEAHLDEENEAVADFMELLRKYFS